jgi:hypothetical protein
MAGHVAGEANHAKFERKEEIISDLYEKINDCSNITPGIHFRQKDV